MIYDETAVAVRLYEERRQRAKVFKGARLYEPSWDLLLFLFIHKDRNVTVGEACMGTGSPRTTGLRHVEEMKSLGYVEYHEVLHDKRTHHVSLSATGTSLMREYLATCR